MCGQSEPSLSVLPSPGHSSAAGTGAMPDMLNRTIAKREKMMLHVGIGGCCPHVGSGMDYCASIAEAVVVVDVFVLLTRWSRDGEPSLSCWCVAYQ